MITSPRSSARLPEMDILLPAAGGEDHGVRRESPYGVPFWRAYVANTLVMTAVALLFRYADFVMLLGGSEFHLGWIVGVGMVGSLGMRLFLGVAIDRYGSRLVWLCSLVVFACSCFAHLAIDHYSGPAIYLVRIVFCSAIAGIFGAAMTFISGRAPVVRMAEMIGMLGTSGFLGIVLGTQVGDVLCGTATIERWQVDLMFLVAGGLGAVAVLFVWTATQGQPRPMRRRRPPLVWLLKRYQPGTVLLVGVAMGIGIGLPATFLRTYAAELDIPRIGLFFAVYAPTAILTRVATRRLPERIGLAPMILIGLGVLAVSQCLLIAVGNEWHFIVPGISYGVGHAILFPTVVAAGSQAFPDRHRGLGTTLMLATFDVGQLVGAPTAGAILHFSGVLGLPSYPSMFLFMAATLSLVGVVFATTARRPESQRGKKLRPPHESRGEHLAEPGRDVEEEPICGGDGGSGKPGG